MSVVLVVGITAGSYGCNTRGAIHAPQRTATNRHLCFSSQGPATRIRLALPPSLDLQADGGGGGEGADDERAQRDGRQDQERGLKAAGVEQGRTQR